MDRFGGLFVPDGKLHLVMGRGEVINPDGSVAWSEDWQRNTLANEGEESVLNVYFLGTSNPSKYLGLLTDDGDPLETDTMASFSAAVEETGGGYARQQITTGDWGSPTLDSGDMQVTAAEKTFGPASGSAWSVKHAFVTTTVSGTGGKFVLWVPLSGVTTVNVGQSFKYTLSVKAQ